MTRVLSLSVALASGVLVSAAETPAPSQDQPGPAAVAPANQATIDLAISGMT